MPLATPRRLLLFFSTLATLSVGGFLAIESWLVYKRDLASVESNLEAQATLLTEHAELAFTTARQVLADIEWEQNRQAMQQYLSSRPLYQRILGTPLFGGLFVANAEGDVIFTAKKFPADFDALAQGALYQAHRQGAYDVVGWPLTLGESGRQMIPVSHRLVDRNGEFAGFAVVLLQAEYFRDFYDRVINGSELRIGMFHRDGTVLILHPSPLAERPTSQHELSALFTAKAADTLLVSSPVDGQDRIAAFRNMDMYPVTMAASYSYAAFIEDLLPAFRRNAILFLIFTGGVILAWVLIDRALRVAVKAREATTGAQRRQQETLQLCHAIAHNLPNGRVFVIERGYRYAFVEGRLWQDHPDYNPQAMVGKTIREVFPADHAARLESLVDAALAGREGEQEVIFQQRVFKAFATPLRNESGQVRRCLLLTQEITRLKDDQKALETLNRELDRLARTDSLLGIANRRELDRHLESEWSRGSREEHPLSLLLVDVDCFKHYNDVHGHPAGDAALQQVASVLSEAIRRPGDLAARYGGEEMAVLLPHTEMDGALNVAQRIHELLTERNIPFAASPVSDRVTVSIGVASMLPVTGQASQQLIDRADQALYWAKASGRSRTEAYREKEAN